ncbi:hypothetical protein JW859_01255 [bacterium]|nr:hypothetical protein [bacterium]
MQAKWLKTWVRLLILVHYACVPVLMLLTGAGMLLGWHPVLCALIAVAAVVFLLTFFRLHIRTGYWLLAHSNGSPADETRRQRRRAAWTAGLAWFFILGALYVYFKVYITFNDLNFIDFIALIYLADTLPSSVLAWDEEPGIRAALVAAGKRLLIAVIAVAALLALNWYVIRPWQHHWGATAEEARRAMPGDELVQAADLNTTRVVTVNATPAEVWPWVQQIGYGRAGLYSLDFLDNNGVPSACTILPEYQDLAVGDRVAIGEGAYMLVVQLEPEHCVVFQFENGPWGGNTWTFGLYPAADGTTRLVSRLRASYPKQFPHYLPWYFIDTFEIIMMRQCLLGIKARAEGRLRSESETQ